MRNRLGLMVIGAALSMLPLVAAPQQGRRAAGATGDEGIPVTDPNVRRACGSCHPADDKNRMTRISYRRATPENWELTIRRMVSLNHVALTPEIARGVIKSLADSNGLAPEEARPAMFEVERRLIDYTYTADKETHDLCSKCHSMGRVISERRTKEEWAGLLKMHPVLLSRDRRCVGRVQERRRTAGADRRAGAGPRRTRRAGRRRQPPAVREGAGSSRGGLSSDVAGVGGLVRRDADAEAGRPLDSRRLPAR
jgi:quinohemoprotein amine dehydrogenase